MSTRKDLFELVDQHFDAERARNIAVSLTDHYRSPGASGYLKAAELIQEAFERSGFDSLEVVDYPVENAWDPIGATLVVEKPTAVTLVDYHSAPSCIAWWSDATGPEGECLEIVDVGTGETPEDFAGRDIRGKAVFIHGTTRRPGWWEAARLSAERGARGLVTDYMLYQTPGIRTPELVPEASQLLRLPEGVRNKVWAFSIPHCTSIKLQQMLQQGAVFVRAHVRVTTSDSVVRNLIAAIEGTEFPEDSILFCAHGSGIKPGANCAEGPGLLVELARTVKVLIDSGLVQRPKRTLKFFVGCEGAGVSGYFRDNPEEVNNIITAITYCSPGHKQEETLSNLLLYRSPDSVPGFINDYLAELIDASPKEAEWVERDGGEDLPLIRFTDHYYTPWSDNTRFAAEGIQAPLIMSWPDRYFHSQLLTPDVIDPRVLRRAALVSGVAGLELAMADSELARAIARGVAARSALRLTRVAGRYRGAEDASRARRHLLFTLDQDVQGLRTVLRLVPEAKREAVAETLRELENMLRDVADREMQALPEGVDHEVGPEVAALVPRLIGTRRPPRWAGLSYADLLEIGEQLAAGDGNAGFNSLRVIADETGAFIDGQRTVADIADAVGFEFDLKIGPLPIHAILTGLEADGHIEFGS